MQLPREACKQCGTIEPMRAESAGYCYKCLLKSVVWPTLSPKVQERIRGRYYQSKSYDKQGRHREPARILPKQIQNLSVGQLLRGWGRVVVG